MQLSHPICFKSLDANDGIPARDPIPAAPPSPGKLPAPAFVVNIATSGNRRPLLKRTLASLANCQLPPGYIETIVVENGPSCGAKEIVHNAPAILNARYMHVPRANKSAAMNAILKTLGNCLIFYTDDDVRLAPDTLTAYSNAAQNRGPGFFFGGPISIDYDSPPPRWLRQYLPRSVIGWEFSKSEQPVDSPIFLGANWAAFSQDIRLAGAFNANLGPGSPLGSTGEETDMQRKLIQSGLTGIFVPAARIWHYVPPERCTPQWAIDRTFRYALQAGARAAAQTTGPFLLPPWWITYRFAKGILRSLIWSHSRDPELRFKAKNRRSYDRGLLRGVRSQYVTAHPETSPRL